MPLVALESAVLTHGLPYPENIHTAQDMEAEVRGAGATPATIAVLDGAIRVGIGQAELERLATEKSLSKVSPRDLARMILNLESGGTTVAGTIFAAQAVGIKVFATGGIGGVHRDPRWDVSADLPQLARTPMIVVCSGAKAILDVPSTLEYLETSGVPVIGYQTGSFPLFYTRTSRLQVPTQAQNPEEVFALASAHWALGIESAVLVAVPPPIEVALPEEQLAEAIRQALDEARKERLRGQQVTPFLLSRVSELTGRASMRANLGLLRNNARVAAEIARVFPSGPKVQNI
jgi:pseudouridine-5'-phosphate glycosidase